MVISPLVKRANRMLENIDTNILPKKINKARCVTLIQVKIESNTTQENLKDSEGKMLSCQNPSLFG